MEILILGLFFIIGTAAAFLSGVVSSINSDVLNTDHNYDEKRIKKILEIKSYYDNSENAFLSTEMFFLILTAITFGIIINEYFRDNYIIFYIIPVLIIPAIIFRTTVLGLGQRLADMVVFKLYIPFIVISVLDKPVFNLLRIIENKIRVTPLEEASRQELNAMFDSAHEEGTIDAGEYRIMKNIIHFNEVLVSDVMTPRTVIFSADADLTVAEAVNLPEIKMYSRFPVFNGSSLDESASGYVLSKDVIYTALKGDSGTKIKNLSREIFFLPETAELDTALDEFLKKRQHQMLVVDEYGGIEGLITLEDILETILGVEIVDEADKFVDLREFAKQRRDRRIASLNIQNPK